MMELEKDKRRLVELALAAGRRRQSKQTGFVHHCYENRDAEKETIPAYENAAFALALFRSKTAENIQEAKILLSKLLSFEVGGNFPVYLHEYPHCRDLYLGCKLKKIFQWILSDFDAILGRELKESLEGCLARIAGEPKEVADIPPQLWNPKICAYVGMQDQERGEPAVTLNDLAMGQRFGVFSRRALEDHPIHLKAALIPYFPPEASQEAPPVALTLDHGFLLLWGDETQTHSLYSREAIEHVGVETYRLRLPEEVPPEDESMEFAFYLNHHPDHQILINGKKATTFAIGDQLEIFSKGMKITLSFSVENGQGKFFGHLLRGNRPRQLHGTKFDAYDWKIALRTLERDSACAICLHLSYAMIS